MPDTQLKGAVVIRLADTQLRAADVPSTYVNRAIQVNDSAALGQIGQYPIEFNPQYQHLTLHRLRLIRADQCIDVLERATVKFIQREAALESGIFSGRVTALILTPDIRVGDTLQITYSISGENPVFGDAYSDAVSWDQSEPVELRQIRVTFPAGRHQAWQWSGDAITQAVKPTEVLREGWRTWTFSGRQLMANEQEPYVPAGYMPYQYLQLSEWKTWNRVARWTVDLFPSVQPQSPALKALVERLRQQHGDEARVVAALQWVQSEVRYFSVSLGESSHRPHPPDEVVEKRFGDCKDKTYLLLTLLQQLGIEARPVLLSLASRDGLHKLMPAPELFDHVILKAKVDGTWYYLDGTRQRQTGALSRMGLGLDGYDGLTVAADTTELQRIESPSGRATAYNELNETIDIAQLKEGPATLTARQTWRGLAAESIRHFWAQASAEQKTKFALMGYERRYPGVQLVAPATLDDHLDRNELTMTVSYSVPKMLVQSNGEWGLRYFPSNLQGLFNIPDNIRRKYPVAVFNQDYDAHYHLTVTWPDTVRVVRDPSVQKVQSTAFDIEVANGFRGNKAQQVIDFHTRRGELKPDELPQFLEDLRRMERAIDGVVYVDRDSIVRADATGAVPAPPSLQDTIRNRLTQRIANLSKTIDAGKLADEDLASALCDRAESLADLGRPQEGLADAEMAVRKAPELARAWACRANLQFANGQFGASVADHGKALGLGYDEFETYYHRGVARYYLDKLPEAASDFERAAQAAPNDSAKRYAMLWWTWTSQRLHRPTPKLIADLSPPPGGGWPWPAQALLLGRLTEDQVLGFVNAKSGDDRQLALAEAWFYIGQNQLLKGQVEAARHSFELARQQGVSVYLEHVAAGFELQRLKSR